ncbi:MAG: hypothetical protein HY814_10645 [Candidatus Riflebacteria bacterium]|nr:hypothetical protein [Candidatus Riflebacteria bacterium]
MARATAYILKGHFEARDCIRLDEPVDEMPVAAVQVTVVVAPASDAAAAATDALAMRKAKADAFRRFMAAPVSEEDQEFWEDFARDQSEARKQGGSRENPI